MNQHLIQRLTAIQQALMAQHQGGTGLPSAVIGNERETFLREFLQKVFPSHFRFTGGVITDAAGRLSGQVDIAVEYPFIPSFPMPASPERLVLAESVLAAVEVKSDLVSQWDQVTQTVGAIKQLRRDMAPLIVFGQPPPAQIPCVAVGYRGHRTIEGLRERLATTPDDRRPDAALVIESGCFEGFGCWATGCAGLYMLCATLTQFSTQLQAVAPDLVRYLQ
ncbi:MAG: DUF6602 domain-containing protein [Verrucomicrobiia bacterium]